jgi:diguanylate cyclase (GGDEF)-like protein
MKRMNITVLYVEDDRDIAEEVIEFLTPRVKKLYVAMNGFKALEMYEQYKPDMIITDVQMPEIDGLEMISIIREKNQEIPIIITSAYNDVNFLLDSINMGVDGYLLKPLDFKVMQQRIKKLVEPLEMREKIHKLNEKLIAINASLEAKIAKAVQEHTDFLTKLNEEIKKRAFYDSVTKLPNRAFIYEILGKEIQKAKRYKTLLALFFIDMDNFKKINDLYGHTIGDKVLLEFAQRLQNSVRESDYIGRLGGDEFILVVSDIQDKKAINVLGEKIRHHVNKPFVFDDVEINISCSIGISCYPRDADNMSKLIENADIAMYSVKRCNKDGIAFYEDL